MAVEFVYVLVLIFPYNIPTYIRICLYLYVYRFEINNVFFNTDVLQYMQDLGQQYKAPFISWMGTKCFLYVNDPETIETIFNSACCTNKGDFYRFMANAIGDGLFTSSCKLT